MNRMNNMKSMAVVLVFPVLSGCMTLHDAGLIDMSAYMTTFNERNAHRMDYNGCFKDVYYDGYCTHREANASFDFKFFEICQGQMHNCGIAHIPTEKILEKEVFERADDLSKIDKAEPTFADVIKTCNIKFRDRGIASFNWYCKGNLARQIWNRIEAQREGKKHFFGSRNTVEDTERVFEGLVKKARANFVYSKPWYDRKTKDGKPNYEGFRIPYEFIQDPRDRSPAFDVNAERNRAIVEKYGLVRSYQAPIMSPINIGSTPLPPAPVRIVPTDSIGTPIMHGIPGRPGMTVR